MRKKGLFCTVLLLILLLLTACSGGLCTDEAILSQLKNDETTPEFVLDGVYYSLPAPLSDFLEQGWEVDFQEEHGDISQDEILLDPNSTVDFHLVKGGRRLYAIAANTQDSTLPFTDGLPITQITTNRESGLGGDFVTKFGVTAESSMKEARKSLASAKLLTSSDTILTMAATKGEDFYTPLDIFGERGQFSITIASLSNATLDAWQKESDIRPPTPEEIEEYRQRFKEAATAATAKYGDDYQSLLAYLQEDDPTSLSYCATGRIDRLIVAKPLMFLYVQGIRADELYIMTDENGNQFAFFAAPNYKEENRMTLAEGDTVAVWGKLYPECRGLASLLKLESGEKIPVIYPDLVEQDGTTTFIDVPYQHVEE